MTELLLKGCQDVHYPGDWCGSFALKTGFGFIVNVNSLNVGF